MEANEIYKKAIEKWGVSLQLVMAIEEMSELTKEISKHLRGKLDKNKIAEEIADVEIMMEQLKILFDNDKKVKEEKALKLLRLSQILKEDFSGVGGKKQSKWNLRI